MKKNKFLLILWLIFVTIAVNFLYFWFIKEEERQTFIKKEKNINEWYKILGNVLIIDYPIFINNTDINFDIIVEKCSWFSYWQLVIENIDWDNFDFLSKITSEIYFKQYEFDFKNYDDRYNYIFDWIDKINFIDSIIITIKWELIWDKNLLQTFKKLREVIYKANVKNFSIHLLGWFFNNYVLSKQEWEEIKNYKVDSFLIMINSSKVLLEEEYIINFLETTKINNFSYLENYFKENWKIYKNENWKQILIE